MNILIIEDIKFVAAGAKEILESIFDNGNKCNVFTTGYLTEGIKLAKETKFDVIFLDLTLLDSEKDETILKIKELSVFGPVSVISKYEDNETTKKCFEAGADSVYDKLILSRIGDMRLAVLNVVYRNKKS